MEGWDEKVLSSGHAGHTECVQLSRLGEDTGGTTVLQHPGIPAECSAQLSQQKGAGPIYLCGPQDLRGGSRCSSGLGTGPSALELDV